MTRTSNVPELQIPLFDQNFEPTLDVHSDAESSAHTHSHLDTQSEGVPMTDLLERSVRLTMALTEMGRISSIEGGFVVAVDTKSGDRIWSDYRDGTRIVERRATHKAEDERVKTVKQYFAKAIGYHVVKKAEPKLMGRREWDKRATRMYKDFKDTFTGPTHSELRDDFRRKLALQITQQKRLRRRNGLTVPEHVDGISIRYSHRLK